MIFGTMSNKKHCNSNSDLVLCSMLVRLSKMLTYKNINCYFIISLCSLHFDLTHCQNSITEEVALRGDVHSELEFFPLSTIQASKPKEIQIWFKYTI